MTSKQRANAQRYSGRGWDGQPCFYCGRPAAEWDHIVPWSHKHDNRQGNLAPACRDCNAILGPRHFPSREHKGAYIHAKLQQRARRVLNIDRYWEKAENRKELGYTLRTKIEDALIAKDVMLQRLAWSRGFAAIAKGQDAKLHTRAEGASQTNRQVTAEFLASAPAGAATQDGIGAAAGRAQT